MIRSRSLIVGVMVLVALCLTASTALAGDSCKKVNAKIWNLSEVSYDSEICNGYDLCQFGDIIGTLNGTMSVYQMFDWWTLLADDTALAFWDDIIIETNKGEIWLQERAIFHLGASGFASHSMVSGGTGDYIEATGWISLIPDPSSSKLLIKGEICTP